MGRAVGSLPVTGDVSARLVRLPLWVDLPDQWLDRVVAEVHDAVEASRGSEVVRRHLSA